MQNDGFWEACKSFAPMMRAFFDNAWKILRWMLLSATGWTTVEALGWTPGTILLSIIPGTIGAFLAGSEFFSWVSQGVTERGRGMAMVGTVTLATGAFLVSMYFGTVIYLAVISAVLNGT